LLATDQDSMPSEQTTILTQAPASLLAIASTQWEPYGCC
jgi:hypothetical protein